MDFFRQMRESVIDFRFYREIKDNRFGKSFVYLLLLFLIIYFIGGTKTFVIIKPVVEELAVQIDNNVPDFKLEKGEFIYEGEMPHYISSSTNEVFVIDTTGQTDGEALENVTSGMVITKDKIYLKQNVGELRIVNLKELEGIELTKADVVEFLPKLSWIVFIFIAFGFIFVLGWKLLNAVILALLGLAANAALNANMKYGNLLNISIYALTLPLLLQLAVDLSGYIVPGFGFIYWAISILYVVMAVKSCRDSYTEDTSGNNEGII
jgi:hypothetical protein